MKKPAPRSEPVNPAPKQRSRLPERPLDPMFIQALDRYFSFLDEGMDPKEASEVLKPVNEFLYDFVQQHGRIPKPLMDSRIHIQTAAAEIIAAQKVGL